MTLPDSFFLQVLASAAAGFVTFFASCLLPLVPTYIAYLSGIALGTTQARNNRFELVKIATIFSAGFIVTFTILGTSFATLGSFLSMHRLLLERIGGVIFILIGLFLLGWLQRSWFNRELRFELGEKFAKWKQLHAFAAGVAFAFGWTPCIGPVLALVLFWATHAGTQLTGSILLAAFGIGLGVPFILVAVAYEQLLPVFRKSQKTMQIVQKIAGVFVIISGALMVAGKFHWIALFLMHFVRLPTLSV